MPIFFLIGFALIGALISTVCGFLAGNRITYILFVSSISTFAFAGLGFGIYTVLEKKVPEFLELLGGFSLGGFGSSSSEDGYDESSGEGGGLESADPSDEMGEGPQHHIDNAMEANLARAKSGKFGDHIIVGKIAIKNEPKLMAEAIRTMMQKEDPTE